MMDIAVREKAHSRIDVGQIRVTYASGIGLREIARSLRIPRSSITC
jgi:hypothetical protein